MRVFSVITVSLVLLLISSTTIYAWLDCPYGRVNDPYPGQCSLYVDTNDNQICDQSEPAPAGVEERSAFWLIFLPAVLYFLHWYLANQTTLAKRCSFYTTQNFRYLWNLVLLLTFIPAGIFGLLLALEVRSEFLGRWHRDGGIVFTVVALLHLLTRFRYFTRGAKLLKQKG